MVMEEVRVTCQKVCAATEDTHPGAARGMGVGHDTERTGSLAEMPVGGWKKKRGQTDLFPAPVFPGAAGTTPKWKLVGREFDKWSLLQYVAKDKVSRECMSRADR